MISAIVCVDENWGIGRNGDLLVHIPEDMQFFKRITDGSMVIMGKKTYDSLHVKPLPNRINSVITSNISNENHLEVRKDCTIRMSLESAKAVLEGDTSLIPWNVYIIGGESIYNELLPYCEYAYVTKVFNSYDNVDTYFPNIDNMSEWELFSTSPMKTYEDIKYQFCAYRKKDIEQ